MEHYLDNSATTRVCNAAVQKAVEIMRENYGNPSSLHSMGIKAEDELERARSIIAGALSCREDEVFFTSGGTEANNTAVFGAANALRRRGNKIVTTAVEHSSVLEAVKELEARGFQATYINPDEKGVVSPEKIARAVDEKTVLVSVMTANNEVGAVNDIAKIPKIIADKKSPALFHTDAVQAFGKIKINAKKLGADLITVSAHKVHGPKGAGALYIKKGRRITSLHFGGEQEKKIRPGTEALPLIAAFGAAVSEFDIEKNYENTKMLNAYAKERLSQIEGVSFNSGENALPYIINISVKGVRSETMLHFLAQNGVFVSSSSACARGKPSYVLKAMGKSDSLADSALRISFSKHSTPADADALCRYIAEGLNKLAKV